VKASNDRPLLFILRGRCCPPIPREIIDPRWRTTDRGEHREAAGGLATPLVHALGHPNSPVCRQDQVKLFLGYGVYPAADSTSARKCESVFGVAVDNGELHIAVERSGIYWLPVHNEFIHPQTDQLRHLRQSRETARLEKGTVAPFSWFLGFRRCHPAISFVVVGA
jgi:hypothetical protein